jgi:hypothetical protein
MLLTLALPILLFAFPHFFVMLVHLFVLLITLFLFNFRLSLTLCPGTSIQICGFHGGDYEECLLLGYKNAIRTSQGTH